MDYLEKDNIGAELGVFQGQFSRILKDSGKFKQLCLVDIFEGFVYSGDKNGENGKTVDINESYKELKHVYKDCSDVKIIKQSSSDFLNSLQDDYLSFVYIDADHSYESVKNDLELSRIKVKNNGIISGHDYDKISFPGVFLAVNEFISKYSLSFITTEQDKLSSYFITNKK